MRLTLSQIEAREANNQSHKSAQQIEGSVVGIHEHTILGECFALWASRSDPADVSARIHIVSSASLHHSLSVPSCLS